MWDAPVDPPGLFGGGFPYATMVKVVGWLEHLGRAYADSNAGQMLLSYHFRSHAAENEHMADMRACFQDFLSSVKGAVTSVIDSGEFTPHQQTILESMRFSVHPEYAPAGSEGAAAIRTSSEYAHEFDGGDACAFSGERLQDPVVLYIETNLADVYVAERYALQSWNKAENGGAEARPASHGSLAEFELCVQGSPVYTYTDYDSATRRVRAKSVYLKKVLVISARFLRLLLLIQQCSKVDFAIVSALHPCTDRDTLERNKQRCIRYAAGLHSACTLLQAQLRANVLKIRTL